MPSSPSKLDELLPLSPATFHILLALASGEKHGYAIMQEVEQRSDGAIKMGPGTLYGAVRRMRQAGWIAECDERPDPELDDERRRYYGLTDLGQRIATAEAQRLARLVAEAQQRGLLPQPLDRLPQPLDRLPQPGEA